MRRKLKRLWHQAFGHPVYESDEGGKVNWTREENYWICSCGYRKFWGRNSGPPA